MQYSETFYDGHLALNGSSLESFVNASAHENLSNVTFKMIANMFLTTLQFAQKVSALIWTLLNQ